MRAREQIMELVEERLRELTATEREDLLIEVENGAALKRENLRLERETNPCNR